MSYRYSRGKGGEGRGGRRNEKVAGMGERHVLAFCSRQPGCNPAIRRDGSGSVDKAVSVRNALAF